MDRCANERVSSGKTGNFFPVYIYRRLYLALLSWYKLIRSFLASIYFNGLLSLSLIFPLFWKVQHLTITMQGNGRLWVGQKHLSFIAAAKLTNKTLAHQITEFNMLRNVLRPFKQLLNSLSTKWKLQGPNQSHTFTFICISDFHSDENHITRNFAW